MAADATSEGARKRAATMTSFHVRRARSGDRESVSWLVSHYTPLLLAQASYRLTERLRRYTTPEDLVHDVWAAVLPRLEELGPWEQGSARVFTKYLSTCLLRRVRDLYAKHIAGKPPAATGIGSRHALGIPADVSGVVTRAARDELQRQVRASIDALGHRERQIVVLRGIEQHRNRDVAAILGLKPNTVAVAYRRALGELRRRLPSSIVSAFASPDADPA